MTQSDLNLGDLIRDNEELHRFKNERVYRVSSISPDWVTAIHVRGGRLGVTRINRKRIHTDDKVRRTGWTRVAA